MAKSAATKEKTLSVDLGLSVLCTLASSGESLSLRDIADVCGCSRHLIHQIEKKALKKFRAKATALGLNDFIQ